MTLGNFAAFYQTSVKRLLAYSTISQAGYLLMAIAAAARSTLAARSLLFYLAAYAGTNLGAFAVVAELPHAPTLASYRGLARRHPGLAAVLLVCLLGLVGTPPTGVFFGKLTVRYGLRITSLSRALPSRSRSKREGNGRGGVGGGCGPASRGTQRVRLGCGGLAEEGWR